MSSIFDKLRRRLNLRDLNAWRPSGILVDSLAPKGDHLHVILKCRGEAKDAIYVDDTQEYRSPALQEGQAADASTPHSP
jgi:hypothetical protein